MADSRGSQKGTLPEGESSEGALPREETPNEELARDDSTDGDSIGRELHRRDSPEGEQPMEEAPEGELPHGELSDGESSEGSLPEEILQLWLPGAQRHLKRDVKAAIALQQMAENQCSIYKREVEELRERLDMFTTAAKLGALVMAQPTDRASPSESLAAPRDNLQSLSTGASPGRESPMEESPQGTSPPGTSPPGTSPQGTLPQGASLQGTSPPGTSPPEILPHETSPQGTSPQGISPDTSSDTLSPVGLSSYGRSIARILQLPSCPVEIRDLKDELDRSNALEKTAREQCNAYKDEVRKLREQLDMFKLPAQLGTLVVSQPMDKASSSEAIASTSSQEGTQTSDELIASLRSELARCLGSNRIRGDEMLSQLQELAFLREEKIATSTMINDSNVLGADLQHAIAVMSHHKEDIERVRREMHEIFNENECYREALKILQEDKARQVEVITTLTEHISSLNNKFEEDKRSAVDVCKTTFEERLKQLTDTHKQELDLAKADVSKMKFLYSKLCVENSVKEANLKAKTAALIENRLMTIVNMQQKEMLNAIQDHSIEPVAGAESELALAHRRCEEMIIEARIACFDDQSKVLQRMLEELRKDVDEMWQTESRISDTDADQATAGPSSRGAAAPR